MKKNIWKFELPFSASARTVTVRVPVFAEFLSVGVQGCDSDQVVVAWFRFSVGDDGLEARTFTVCATGQEVEDAFGHSMKFCGPHLREQTMKLYIAGKITGLNPLAVEENFCRAARYVEGFGHEALNPVEMFPVRDDWTWEYYMAEDVKVILMQADGLFMLSNWRESRGARAEHAFADALGKKIFYQASVIPEAE